MNRRNFIKNSGCLAIGFSLRGADFSYATPLIQELPQSIKENPKINAWLEILANGQIRIFTGKIELGQGIQTAIAQVAAEELDVDIDNVEVVLADTGRTPDEGYTVGSGSIEQSAMAVRYAAAAGRQKLLELASQQLAVPVSQLTINNGQISSVSGNKTISFAGVLNGKQITDEVKGAVALKAKAGYKLVGKSIPRKEISDMVKGRPVYIQDLRFDGMVYACVVRQPAYEAKLLQVDEKSLKNIPGVLKVVMNGSFLGVIAQDEYQAVKAQQWLRQHSEWSAGVKLPVEATKPAYFKSLPAKTERIHEAGVMPATSEANTIKAAYFKPYIMHASIGPSCAVAIYENGRLHVWSHSQGVYPLREALAKMVNLSTDNIQITGVPGSGCYGHNGADDAAADAALLAMAYPGKHIRLQWTRDDEHAWEPYGSAMVMELSAGLTPSGNISFWKYDFWSDTHVARPMGIAANLLPAQYLSNPFINRDGGIWGGAQRNSEPYYTIPNQQIDAHWFKGPLRVSALRSLGAYANAFAIESFMDELAERAGIDPFTFRLMHLNDDRAKEVIRKVQDLIKSEPVTAHTGIGIAFSRYKNSASYCAAATKVYVDPKDGSVHVQKMWAAIDAGETINTDGLKNQTEGGLIQSVSWTLLEQVRFDTKHILSRDWVSYPILRFTQTPEVVVEVLNQPSEKAMGAGEAAQGPAAAALVNAIYKACGKRIRHLPVGLRLV